MDLKQNNSSKYLRDLVPLIKTTFPFGMKPSRLSNLAMREFNPINEEAV
jgi:hypothetical protein